MLFLFSQPYLRSVPGLKKNLCCGDMTLIFLHTPSLQDCDGTVLDKLDSLNDSEPKVRRFRAKPFCSLSSCEDYPLEEPFWSPCLLVIIELKQQRRRRYENVTWKVNSRCLKLYRSYFWSWILKDCIKVLEKKIVALYSHPRQNVKLGSSTL